jgi:lysophospholipase L1-like esterase
VSLVVVLGAVGALVLEDPVRPRLGAEVVLPSTTTTSLPDAAVAGMVLAAPGALDPADERVDAGPDGCQVAIVGDSLVAWAEDLHEEALEDVRCAALVDGEGGRILGTGWQCPNGSCWASGLKLLEQWKASGTLGDLVVVALGTNDAVGRGEEEWVESWEAAYALTDPRPVLFVTTAGRPGDQRADRFVAYNEALVEWCEERDRCVLVDWAAEPEAADRSSYVDYVHLGQRATEVRARFLAEAAAAVLDTDVRDPAPFPRPTQTFTPPRPSAEDAGSSTTTTSVSSGSSTTTSTPPESTTTSTASTTTTSTTTTTTTTTTTAPPAA